MLDRIVALASAIMLIRLCKVTIFLFDKQNYQIIRSAKSAPYSYSDRKMKRKDESRNSKKSINFVV